MITSKAGPILLDQCFMDRFLIEGSWIRLRPTLRDRVVRSPSRRRRKRQGRQPSVKFRQSPIDNPLLYY